MAMQMQVSGAVALVTGEPRERQTYSGSGESRTVAGRATDAAGRPVSGVSAVVVGDSVGLVADATVLLPDAQMTGLMPGAVIRLDGDLSMRLVGGDYGSVRATFTGERLTPLGDGVAALRAMGEKAGKSETGRAA